MEGVGAGEVAVGGVGLVGDVVAVAFGAIDHEFDGSIFLATGSETERGSGAFGEELHTVAAVAVEGPVVGPFGAVVAQVGDVVADEDAGLTIVISREGEQAAFVWSDAGDEDFTVEMANGFG